MRALEDEVVKPAYGAACFDGVPGTVERLLTGASSTALSPAALSVLASRWERVVLVYFDAFGWDRFEAHAQHPLFRLAADCVRLTGQWPSTTTAQVVTAHTGLRVGDHGLYEWLVYEPELDRVIAPLPFSFAGDAERETLREAPISPDAVFPARTVYQRLHEQGVRAALAHPTALADGTATRALGSGAEIHPYDELAEGLAAIAGALAREGGYGFVYVRDLDGLLHLEGPASAAAPVLVERVLDELERHLVPALPADTLVLLTADHGMAPVSPEDVVYVDRLWPEIVGLVPTGADGEPLAPAGSSRDLFLHVTPGAVDDVAGELGDRLLGLAEVVRVEELVRDGYLGPHVGDALLARLADVVVLPRWGEAVFWHGNGRFEQPWRGMHGGRSPHEMYVPLVALVT